MFQKGEKAGMNIVGKRKETSGGGHAPLYSRGRGGKKKGKGPQWEKEKRRRTGKEEESLSHGRKPSIQRNTETLAKGQAFNLRGRGGKKKSALGGGKRMRFGLGEKKKKKRPDGKMGDSFGGFSILEIYLKKNPRYRKGREEGDSNRGKTFRPVREGKPPRRTGANGLREEGKKMVAQVEELL